MPDHAFDIATTTPHTVLDNGKGEVRFTLSNALGREARVNAFIEVEERGRVDWIALDGVFPRTLEADLTAEVTARVAAPEVMPKGLYRMRLVVASTENPDEERSTSRWVTVEHTGVVAEKKPFPWWLVALVGGVVLLAGGGYGIYELFDDDPVPVADAGPPDAGPPDAPPPPRALEETCTPGGTPCEAGLFCSPTRKVCLKAAPALKDSCDPAASASACPDGTVCRQEPAGQPHRCLPRPRDIMLVLQFTDNIGSIRGELQALTSRFVDELDQATDGKLDGVISNGIRIGVVGFSERASLAAPLTADARQVKQALGSLSSRGFRADYQSGIAAARDQLAHAKHDRAMLLFIAPSPFSDPRNGAAAARAAKEQGIEIFGVGLEGFSGGLFGTGDVQNLRHLVSDPVDRHVFFVRDVGAMRQILDKLAATWQRP